MIKEAFVSNNKVLIRDAFISILSKESFYDITVKNIIEVAGVSRSTFYNYYQDKQVLLKEIQGELIDGFLAVVQDIGDKGLNYLLEAMEGDDYRICESFFSYIKKKQKYLKVLFKENNGTNFRSVFLVAMNKAAVKVLKHWGLYDAFAANMFSDYIMQILTAAGIVTFTKWLKSDMKISERDMTCFFFKFWNGNFHADLVNYAKQRLDSGNDDPDSKDTTAP